MLSSFHSELITKSNSMYVGSASLLVVNRHIFGEIVKSYGPVDFIAGPLPLDLVLPAIFNYKNITAI